MTDHHLSSKKYLCTPDIPASLRHAAALAEVHVERSAEAALMRMAASELECLRGPGNPTQMALDAATKPLDAEIERLRKSEAMWHQKWIEACADRVLATETPPASNPRFFSFSSRGMVEDAEGLWLNVDDPALAGFMSAFTCPNCKGSGMVEVNFDGHPCNPCEGTGRVNAHETKAECFNPACVKAHDDVVDLLRSAVTLHKRNCDCEACYWLGRVPGPGRHPETAAKPASCEHPRGRVAATQQGSLFVCDDCGLSTNQ